MFNRNDSLLDGFVLRGAPLLAWMVMLAGCGRATDEVAVYPVSGKVLHRGAPAEGAKVVVYNVDRQDATTPIPTGIVQSDGTFRLTSYKEGDGAPAGKYKATVIWLEPIPEGFNAEMYSPADRLGGRYADPERSGLEVTVSKGVNVLEPFELQ